MGRRRAHNDPDRPLPTGLYRHGRQYRARRTTGGWQYFGTDYVAAMASFAAWRRDGPVGTVGWLLDLFTGTVCAGYVKAKRLAPRTARDYARDKLALQDGLGHIPLAALTSRHVAEYRDARAQDAPSHVRNELACLSAACSYAVEAGRMTSNPCRGVRKPTRTKRERLIGDDEYLGVYALAGEAVRRAMLLALRTLALPADVLQLGPRNVHRLPDERRVLRFARGKTGVLVEIELVGELAALIDRHLAADVVFATFVHRRDGKAFTVDGIGAMFRRYCGKGKAAVADFGLRDLRAKGATDMYRSGIELRQIQRLLGHRSVRTTEIYLKSLVAETVRPNETPVVASLK